MTYEVSASREIGAPVAKVWDMVTDLPRMGEWSPENRGGRWLGGATAPAVGVGFRGVNRNGLRRWSTTVTITECTPGEVFEFAVKFGFFSVANWRYEFAASGLGCRVTESWVDRRHPLVRITGQAMGSHDAEHTRVAMAATLEKLAAAAAQR